MATFAPLGWCHTAKAIQWTLGKKNGVRIRQIRLFSQTSALQNDSRTHYEVLDIPRDASFKQIKEAYLKKTKEMHPDKLRSTSINDKERAVHHSQILAVNEAYAILSKAKDRRIYDLGLPGDPNSSEDRRYSSHAGRSPYQNLSFEERKRMYGFPSTNPDYYDRRETRKVALACFLFVIFGTILHIQIIKLSFNKHAKTMDERTQRLAQLSEDVKKEWTFETEEEYIEHMNAVAAEGKEHMKKETERMDKPFKGLF